MMEIIARHPAGEKAAAGSSQDSPYTRYQAVNSVSTADDTVAPPNRGVRRAAALPRHAWERLGAFLLEN